MLFVTLGSYESVAQIKYNELIDTSVLSSAEFKVLENLNTKNLEFSPTNYNGGLVFVSSSPNGKRKVDESIGETFFSLLYAPLDSLGNVEEVENFSYCKQIQDLDTLETKH